MPNINKNIIMQAGAAVANATNKAAGLSASTPVPGSIISAIQLVNGGRKIGPADVVHFTESVRNKLLSLLVSMEPIQDLHGYDSPWPAGGGKNKFITTLQTQSAYGTTFTVNADGSITVSGTPTQLARVSMRSGSFVDTSSVCVFSTGVSMPIGTRVFCVRNHEGAVTYPTISNTHIFTVGDTYSNMLLEIDTSYDGDPFTLYPMIEDGSTATAWAPYSNICPISGRTGVNVYRTGKNIWPFNAQYSPAGYSVLVNKAPCYLPAGTYTFSAIPNIASDSVVLFGYHADGTRTEIGRLLHSVEKKSASANILKDVVSLHFVSNSGGNISEIQLELSSTATTYEPYNGNTYSVDWTTQAGTVYGGSADIVTGEIKAAPYYASYNGETLVGPWVSSMDVYNPDGTPTTGAQVVDLGGTMTEYHITGQDIITLAGDNYIWSDSGDVTITE